MVPRNSSAGLVFFIFHLKLHHVANMRVDRLKPRHWTCESGLTRKNWLATHLYTINITKRAKDWTWRPAYKNHGPSYFVEAVPFHGPKNHEAQPKTWFEFVPRRMKTQQRSRLDDSSTNKHNKHKKGSNNRLVKSSKRRQKNAHGLWESLCLRVYLKHPKSVTSSIHL